MRTCVSRRIVYALGLLLGVVSTAVAADNNAGFVGKWKLNPSRSKLIDIMKVESAGGNKYAFDFGSGKPETIVADGSDQPGADGTTFSVKVEAPNKWTVVRKQDGHTVITASWDLSPDGNTLTDHFTAIQPDGNKFSVDYTYKRTSGKRTSGKRTAGTAGFAGTWESDSQQINSVIEIQIQPFEGDGLSITNAAAQATRNVKFDGKEYPASGAGMPKGFTASGHRVDTRNLELTDKVNGEIVDKQQVELSSDLKTLTISVRTPNQSKPNILVFERE